MAEGTQNNSWVESYLEALLSYGLSTEYSKAPQSTGKDKVDADRDKYAKFYVHQILSMGEEGIRDAYRKATSTQHYSEESARMEYLAWRTWFMKQARNRRRAAKKVSVDDLPDDSIVDNDSTTSGDEEGHGDGKPESLPSAQPSVDEERATGEPKAKADVVEAEASKAATGPADDGLVVAGSADLGLGKLRVDTAKPGRGVEALVDLDVLTPHTEEEDSDPFAGRVDGLYIVLISLHGLIRGQHMELGRDADTGGQVKYVVELARAIATHPAVHRVELLTRLVQDPKVSPDYGVEEECILKGDGELGGAYIVRLPAGDPKIYLRKEQLWPHVREFADRGIQHISSTLRRLQEASEPCSLYTIHGHYADAGEVAALMALTMAATEDCDMVMTGHSLGRNKLEHLLATGTTSKEEIEANYKISRRIEGEERALDVATMVFTSTQQEVNEQWGLYDGYDVKLEQVLRNRRRTGRHMPFMNVVPPGLDFSNLKVDLPEDPNLKDFHGSKPAFISTPRAADSPRKSSPGDKGEKQADGSVSGSGEVPTGASPKAPTSDDGSTPKAGLKSMRHSDSMMHMQLHMHPIAEENPHIWQEIGRFLRNPRKPAILAMSRPDAKKNITTLVNAFGKHPMLRELANLVLIMGNRDNIDSMASGSQKVLTQVMKLIDLHDLYGSVAYPKKHSQNDISDIYRLPLVTHGIFTNIALQEPFGLTVIEAAAHGVPTVATRNGGPVDIMKTLHHGVVVDPTNEVAVAEALLNILTNPTIWQDMSKSGVKNIHAYSWLAHARKYLDSIAREKKYLSTQKKFGARLSGNWDHHSLDQKPASGGTPTAGQGQTPTGGSGQFSMDRAPTMPAPRANKDFLSRGSGKQGSGSSLAKEGSGSGQRGLAAVSMHAVPSGMQDVEDLTPRGFGRDGFVVVPLDGPFRAAAVGAALKKVAEAVKAGSGNIGVGIVTMLGFEDVAKLLKGQQVSPESIDWVICHGGADIWHAEPSADGKGIDWKADEQWERHIDWRWERASLARLLSKVAVAEMERTGSKRLPLLTNISSMDISHLEKQGRPGIHPHHIVMELDAAAKEALGAANGKTSKSGLPSTTVVDRLRKRLRCNGYRVHLTLQMLPGDPGLLSRVGITSTPLTSAVHVTPLRASRALGLRFLAHKFGVDMSQFSLLVVAPSADPRDGDALVVGTNTSDLQELISGLPRVFVAMPDSPDPAFDEGKLAAADKVAFEKMTVKLAKKMFGERVNWGKASEGLDKVLPQTKADSKDE